MPLYEYRLQEGPKSPQAVGCAYCLDGFTELQSLSDPELEKCPDCGAPVERVFSVGARMRTMATKKFSAKDLERKGFTQLKRVEKGVYEKTAGKGPRIIKA